eukprot:scaffold50162_cov41-Phaeocystis_antarctica.AAC.2
MGAGVGSGGGGARIWAARARGEEQSSPQPMATLTVGSSRVKGSKRFWLSSSGSHSGVALGARMMTTLYSTSRRLITNGSLQRQAGYVCSSVVRRRPRSGCQRPSCSDEPVMTTVSPHRVSTATLNDTRAVSGPL